MTRTKTFIIVAILLAFVSVFGVWTGSNNAETRYADSQLYSTYANETVSYTRKEVVGPVYTLGNCPYFHSMPEMTNACGAVAGAELVAFYDRYFPDLIPDWTPYYTSNNNYRRQDSTYVPAVMRQLYTLMRTNVDDVGVSRSDFLNGLTSYFNSKGRQISYQSVTSFGKLNYEQCKTAINNNKAIVLFALPTDVYDVALNSNSDTIISTSIASAHIMVAFGYCEIKYYNASGLFRTDTYLMVAMGKAGYTYKFYRVDSADTEAAYIVNVQ